MVTRFLPLAPDDFREVAGYVLRARLGSGGMGDVFLSFTPGGRAIAIKLMRREFADDPEFRRRFRGEVSAAQRVQGLYTAPVVDADPDAPLPWLATAYVPGPSLQQAVADHGAFPLPSVFRLLGGVAEGLTAIHAAGLIHRDLKPSNVLLAQDGPRVIDFGIAYAADASTLTTSGVVMGTPAFMAPEQALGRAVTPATDVFALGHLALFAATGRGAFGEGHGAALIYRIVNEPPDLRGCPDSVYSLIDGCLAKNPARRPGLAEIISHAKARLGGQTMQVAMSSWLPRPVAATLSSYDATLTRSPAVPSHRRETGPAPAVPPDRTGSDSGWTRDTTYGTAGHSWSPDVAPSVRLATGPPAFPPAAEPRRRRRGGVVAAVLAAAALAAVVVAFRAAHPGGFTPPGAQRTPPAAQGAPVASQGGTTSTPPAGYALEYPPRAPFTMHGGGCASLTPTGADLNSASGGPSVTSNPIGLNDMTLECSQNLGGDFYANIQFSYSDQVADFTGRPSARACNTVLRRQPLPGNPVTIPFSQLYPGRQLCVTDNFTSQLVLLAVVSRSDSTYDLSWTATAWTIPSSNLCR